MSEQSASGTLGRPLMQKGVIAGNSSHYWRESGKEAMDEAEGEEMDVPHVKLSGDSMLGVHQAPTHRVGMP